MMEMKKEMERLKQTNSYLEEQLEKAQRVIFEVRKPILIIAEQIEMSENFDHSVENAAQQIVDEWKPLLLGGTFHQRKQRIKKRGKLFTISQSAIRELLPNLIFQPKEKITQPPELHSSCCTTIKDLEAEVDRLVWTKGNLKREIQEGRERETSMQELIDTLLEEQEKQNAKDASQNRNDDDDEEECSICLSEKPEIVFDPCGHICSCYDCSKIVDACHICRKEITNRIRVYR